MRVCAVPFTPPFSPSDISVLLITRRRVLIPLTLSNNFLFSDPSVCAVQLAILWGDLHRKRDADMQAAKGAYERAAAALEEYSRALAHDSPFASPIARERK